MPATFGSMDQYVPSFWDTLCVCMVSFYFQDTLFSSLINQFLCFSLSCWFLCFPQMLFLWFFITIYKPVTPSSYPARHSSPVLRLTHLAAFSPFRAVHPNSYAPPCVLSLLLHSSQSMATRQKCWSHLSLTSYRQSLLPRFSQRSRSHVITASSDISLCVYALFL